VAKGKTKHIQSDVSWGDVQGLRGQVVGEAESKESRLWRSLYLYVIGVLAFGALIIGLVNIQVVEGREYTERSKHNRLEEQVVQPDRGVIYDRNGEKIATNVPAFNVAVDPREVDDDELDELWRSLSGMLDVNAEDLEKTFDEALEQEPLIKKIVLVLDVDRDQVLAVRSHADDLPGVLVEYASKRDYVGGDMFAHILGYTGEVDKETMEDSDDLSFGDIVGKDGVEFQYDERLRGEKGKRVIEIDAAQNVVAEYTNAGDAPLPGDSIYLSVDADMQRKWHELLLGGMERYDATGGAAVLMDVNSGEVLSAVSVPSYDANLFIGGIAEDDYARLISDSEGIPLFNRVISAQVPPGSMFKTLVASAALESGSITPNTVFNSTGVIYLGDGTYPFQEYHQHAYGNLDLIGGIAKSSNIYFCRTMLAMGIDTFVPYGEFFGIGTPTGIDLPGEAAGRLPSPENKIALAESSPWLDPIWYPEGDDCNSAIGQGITTVTPMQVVNWVSVIANGGKVVEPHLVHEWEMGEFGNDGDQEMELVETNIVREGMVSDANLAIVREGMRNSASGSLSVIVPLRDAKIPTAAKTGTAEFGVKDEKGYYTRTHAWVTGFFPYDEPQYAFVVFLEGGGESNNSAQLAREFIDWYAVEKVGGEGVGE